MYSSVVFGKNRPNWNIFKNEFSNFDLIFGFPIPKYLRIHNFSAFDISPGGSNSTRGQNIKKVHIAIFLILFLTYIMKVPHVIYHWIALELGYPKIVLIARYIPSPGIIMQKCHFLKKTVFPDFPKIKKQPSLNFCISRQTLKWCIRIKNKIRAFCFARCLGSQKWVFDYIFRIWSKMKILFDYILFI